MKKLLYLLLIAFSLSVFVSMAQAAEPPVKASVAAKGKHKRHKKARKQKARKQHRKRHHGRRVSATPTAAAPVDTAGRPA